MEYETKAYAVRFAREVAVEKVPCTHVNRAPSLYNNSWRTNDQIKERCRVGWCQIVCVLLFPFSLFRQNNGVKHKTFFNGTLVTKERFRQYSENTVSVQLCRTKYKIIFPKIFKFSFLSSMLSSHLLFTTAMFLQLDYRSDLGVLLFFVQLFITAPDTK